MKNFFSIWLLIFFSCKLFAQNTNIEENLFHLFQKDSVVEIEELIDTAKQLSSTDSSIALNLLRAAAVKANRQQILYLEAQVYFEAGGIYYAYRNYNRSIAAYTRARNIFQKAGAVEEEALSFTYMARSQYYRGNYTLAAQNLNTAIERGRTVNSKLVEAEADEYLGLLYNYFQDFTAGISFSKKSLEIKKIIGDEIGYLRVASMISNMCYDAQKFDSAFYYARIALQAAEKKNMQTDMYMARFSMAASLIRLKKWSKAEKEISLLHKDSLQSDINFLIHYYVLKANYCLAKNDKRNCTVNYDSA